MTVGCPNHLNASTTRDNAPLYWQKGNHPSIRAKIDQVMTTMNKEERNNYVIHVPHWLWRFVPHCFITPQHILEKQGKKDR
jgi:ABC-type phosphate/phosphonate transport system substrate-binding protein